jgi:chemotaxis protein methyltransferase CheR
MPHGQIWRESAGMERPLSESLFRQFSELVYDHCGINLHDGKKALLQARLGKRLRATGIGSYDAYFKYITHAGNEDEFVHFVDSISTNLTFFFREQQHFDYLEQVLLPQALANKKRERNNRLRIWSAACSTGEEPYSIAMSVSEHLEDALKWDFKVLATDISTRVLEMASRGVYSQERIQKVPPAMRQQYLQKRRGKDGTPEYAIAPSLKQMIVFRQLNLQDPFPFKGPFDCIFCRNVMIYFDKKTQESLVNKMAKYLAPGGCLFVGHSESLTGLNHPLNYVRPAVYKN